MGQTTVNSTSAVEWYLEQWGRWAMQGRGVVRGYPGIEPYTRLLGSTVPEVMIDDEVGIRFDRLMADLCEVHPDVGTALSLRYLLHKSNRSLGRQLGIDHRKAGDLVRSGVMWLDGRLHLE